MTNNTNDTNYNPLEFSQLIHECRDELCKMLITIGLDDLSIVYLKNANFEGYNQINLDDINTLNLSVITQSIYEVKQKYLGKGSAITKLNANLKNLPPEQKKQFGQQIHQTKLTIESFIDNCHQLIERYHLEKQIKNDTIDVTLPPKNCSSGSIHPISDAFNDAIEIFNHMGFNLVNGPEIENEHYNFEMLNISKNHPARDMQDTFYLSNGLLLRTHTSPVQIRYSRDNQTPIKIISPGRVYRVDMDDTHSPMFHQLEGLWVDKNISFAHLKWMINEFLQLFFNNQNLKTRLRASFFPFTEPSAEVDIMHENGSWLEVGGCGMVHPQVLKNMNIDPSNYSGFAFGFGIDRFAMIKYAIHDLRQFFSGDIDFLRAYKFNNLTYKK